MKSSQIKCIHYTDFCALTTQLPTMADHTKEKSVEAKETVTQCWVDEVIDGILGMERRNQPRADLLGHFSVSHVTVMARQITKEIDSIDSGENSTLIRNVCGVYIRVTKDDGKWGKWGIWGDLQLHIHRIPKIKGRRGNRLVWASPIRGTNHSRWYDLKKTRKMLERLALEFRLLSMYMEGRQITPRVVKPEGSVGTLGVQVTANTAFVDGYDSFCRKNVGSKISLDDQMNPRMVAPGLPIFKKNGTNRAEMAQACRWLGCQIPCFYRREISWPRGDGDDREKTELMADQIQEFCDDERVKFAMVSYAKHQRILMKVGDTLVLMDPRLKSGVENHHMFRLIEAELALRGIVFHFRPRTQCDQPRGEGSCSVAALARAMQMAMRYEMTLTRCLLDHEDKASNENEEGTEEATNAAKNAALMEGDTLLEDSVIMVAASIVRLH